MTKANKALIKAFAAIMFGVMVLLIVLGAEARAGGNNNTTNNYYVTELTEITELTEVTNVTQVTESSMTVAGGLSRGDLLSISGAALAGGSHQFDYSTTRWQLSLTGSFATSDWDTDNEYSFGIGRRFGKDSWLPNALFHGSYTPVMDDGHITLGVTIVLE